MTHCIFMSNKLKQHETLTVVDFMNNNQKFNVSLDGTLLSHTTNPFTFHCRNLKCRCLRSLLHWVLKRYVSLFKLWTVYSWLTFQFSTVPGPNLETEGTLRSDNGNTSKNATEKLNSGPNSNYFSSKLSSLLKIGK